MQILPSISIGSYQFSISPSQLYYDQDKDLGFVYCQDTKHIFLFGHDVTLQEEITIEDNVILLEYLPLDKLCWVAVQSDHTVWLYEYLHNDKRPLDNDRRFSKRPKLDQYGTNLGRQYLFQTKSTVDWVQHVGQSILHAFSVESKCVYIYDLKSARHETIALPQQLVRPFSNSHPTCFIHLDVGNDKVSALNPLFADHFGVNMQNGILLGFENGCIYFIPRNSPLETAALVIQLHFEAIVGIHVCDLIGGNDGGKDIFIVAGSKGTIQLYVRTQLENVQQDVILFKEFSIPSPILSISFIKESCSSLVLCENRSLYLVSWSQITLEELKRKDITMQLIALESPEDICELTAVKKSHTTITYQLITKSNIIVSYQVDLTSSPVTIPRNSSNLKKAIETTLAELSYMESKQSEIDKFHEEMNQQLITMNRMLYTLQNYSKKEESDRSKDFNLDICPFVRSAPLTGVPQLYFHLCIQTQLSLNWEDWQLNIDLSHQRTSTEELNAYSLGSSEYVPTKSFYLQLNGFEIMESSSGTLQSWSRDIEFNASDCRLPCDLHASLTLNSPSHSTLDNNDVSVLEYLPVGSNATNSGITFSISFMVVDALHFTMPLPSVQRKQIQQSGLKLTPAQMKSKKKESTELHDRLQYCETIIKLRFISPANKDDLYRSVLVTLLCEGKERDQIQDITIDPEHAYFSLATYPKIPVAVILSISDLSEEDLYVNVRIQCSSTLVLLKVEASLLSRLEGYVINDEEHTNSQDTTSYYSVHQQLEEKLSSLESLYQQHYQQEVLIEDGHLREELWLCWDMSRKHHNERYLSIRDFNL